MTQNTAVFLVPLFTTKESMGILHEI